MNRTAGHCPLSVAAWYFLYILVYFHGKFMADQKDKPSICQADWGRSVCVVHESSDVCWRHRECASTARSHFLFSFIVSISLGERWGPASTNGTSLAFSNIFLEMGKGHQGACYFLTILIKTINMCTFAEPIAQIGFVVSCAVSVAQGHGIAWPRSWEGRVLTQAQPRSLIL